MPSSALITLSLLVVAVLATVGGTMSEDREYWNRKTTADLEAALNLPRNDGIAKNVILFIGDGMGPNTVAATRIYHKRENGQQAFEKFPHVGVIKTYSADHIVPDSASTATAMYTGVKVNSKTAGVDTRVHLGDCATSLDQSTHLQTILDWAQAAGKATGFVTTTRITHATPMALYAHTADRNWECDAALPPAARECKDIARQLVEDAPGRNIQVIMGGGRQALTADLTAPEDGWTCVRADGQDLEQKWAADKRERGLRHALLHDNADLAELDPAAEYVLGVFANGHMPYDYARDTGPGGQPSLRNMTNAAIRVLRKNRQGFLLMVEGGLIDQAHHRGKARKALDEAAVFDDAVRLAAEMTSSQDTLIIVTADHDHSLTFSGYPKRGASVLGISQIAKMDNISFTTLNYAIGGSNNYQFDVTDGKVVRRDPLANKTDDFEYSQQTGIHNDEAIHGGGDVFVFAQGPMAHLFHTVHEQAYIGRVISYAAGIGQYTNRTSTSTSGQQNIVLSTCLISLCLSSLRFL